MTCNSEVANDRFTSGFLGFLTPVGFPVKTSTGSQVCKRYHSSIFHVLRTGYHSNSYSQVWVATHSKPPPSKEHTERSDYTESSPSSSSSLPSEDEEGEAATQTAEEDALTARVRSELAADGIDLDDLLDASKTLKLVRELDKLEQELSQAASDTSSDSQALAQKRARADTVRKELARVRKQVMKPFLKRLFLTQAIIFAAVGGLLASDSLPGIDVPLVGRALGFWTVWLFTIPALRARKGIARWEKSALNISFVSTPLVNVALPLVTKQCTAIWAADVAILLGCYAYYFRRAIEGVDSETQTEQAKIKGFLKYLDWGSWR